MISIGVKHGNLTVLGRSARISGHGNYYWWCKCDCGKVIEKLGFSIGKKALHCGCLTKEKMSNSRRKHGASTTRNYKRWAAIKDRCLNKESKSYKNYGGRGIKICQMWHKYENFLSDMGTPNVGMTIERINNDGNYEPKNCRWATREDQNNNHRRNVKINFDGRTFNITQWAKIMGLTKAALTHRFNRGWTIERALTEPQNYKKQ